MNLDAQTSTNIGIIGMFFVTLITRVGFMFFNKSLLINDIWQYILRIAPAVALASTIALDTFFIQNNFLGFIYNFRLLAILVAIIVFYISKKVWVSLIFGILTWLLIIYLTI